RIDAAEARREISEGRRILEQITAAPVRLFAYPNGKPHHDYTAEHVALVKALGFEAAVSTTPGVAHALSDRFQLPRFMPWDSSAPKFLLRLIQNTYRTDAECVAA